MLLTEEKVKIYNELYFSHFDNRKFSKFRIFDNLKTSYNNSSIKLNDIKIAFAHLGNDRGQAMKIIELVSSKTKGELSWYDYLEKVINILAIPYLSISETAKTQYAEVFTPIWVVDKMLDKYPEKDFKNPSLKWFDPANGIGNFPIRLIQRLLLGLADVEGFEDENVRYKHIIENMIYACEIQPINMFAYMFFIDPNCEFDINIFRGSFIEAEFDFVNITTWNLQKDIRIIGNPPFQSNANKANKLWIKFSNKCVKISDNVNFIVPISLMRSNSVQTSKLRRSLADKNNTFDLRFQTVFDVAEKVVIFTTFYTDNKPESKIILSDNKKLSIDNTKLSSRLPIDDGNNSILSILEKVETKGKLNKIDFVYDFYYNTNQTTPAKLIAKGLVSETKDDIFKYKVHHSASRLLYAKDELNTYGKLKVLFNYSGGYVGNKYMFMSRDLIGKQMVGILVDNEEEGNTIINNYSLKLFQFYMVKEKTGGFNTGLFKIPHLPLIKISDNDLYDYFELTEQEIEIVEDFFNDL